MACRPPRLASLVGLCLAVGASSSSLSLQREPVAALEPHLQPQPQSQLPAAREPAHALLAHAALAAGGRVAALEAALPPLPPVSENPLPPSPPPNSTAPSVPRKLFMFWDDATPPDFIAACIERIVQVNPGWTLYLLKPGDPLSMTGLVDPLPSAYLDMPHVADWYRISALAKHGGVWMDASAISVKPIEAWVDVHSTAQVQGFAMPGNTDDVTMENWAIAAPYPSPFVRQWRDNFRRALEMGMEEYCKQLPDSMLGALGRTMLPYLTQHAAWREARHQLPWAPVRVVKSDSPAGPFYLLTHVFHSSAKDLMSTGPEGALNIDEPTWHAKYDQVAFVKLRGAERVFLQPLASYHGYLAQLLTDALTKGYVGGDYVETNPYSVWWWIRLNIATTVGGTIFAAALAVTLTYCVLTRCPSACCRPMRWEQQHRQTGALVDEKS